MKLTITLEEAKALHKEYYNSEFVITNMARSGQFDFPPWSFVYGLSDFGCWEGNISTDGENFVVTKAGIVSADKVKDVYKFSREDIKDIKVGVFKTTFKMKKHIPGLTKRGAIAAWLFISTAGLVLGLFFPKRIFQVRTKNQYDTEKQFSDLLKDPEKKVSVDTEKPKESSTPEPEQSESSENGTPEDRLTKLNELKDKGMISEDEFNKKKEEIMKLI